MPRKLLFCVLFFFVFISTANAGKVAIIGGGGAGLATAYLTETEHDVTLYEANAQLGGHVLTEQISQGIQTIAVDAGPEFINSLTYPNLLKLLEALLVPMTVFGMTFHFFNMNTQRGMVFPLKINGQIQWNTLRPSNLINLIQLKWVIYKGRSILSDKRYGITIEEFINGLWLTQGFKDEFLYPFLAAQWGLTIEQTKNMAAFQALKYISDGEASSDEWIEIPEGMASYVERLEQQLNHTNIRKQTRVANVEMYGEKYRVVDADGNEDIFDQVVFAVNPIITAKLLKNVPLAAGFKEDCEKVETFYTRIGLCEANQANARFLPAQNSQTVNVRFDGRNAAMAINKSWKASPGLPSILKIWLSHDVRSEDDDQGAMPDSLYSTHEFEHVYMNTAFYQAYQSARQLESQGCGLWFPGIHELDSHESAISTAVDVSRQIAPTSRRLGIFDG